MCSSIAGSQRRRGACRPSLEKPRQMTPHSYLSRRGNKCDTTRASLGLIFEQELKKVWLGTLLVGLDNQKAFRRIRQLPGFITRLYCMRWMKHSVVVAIDLKKRKENKGITRHHIGIKLNSMGKV